MCLLHTHPAATEFDFDDIADFYTHNSDGLGVMYSQDDELFIRKFLPKSSEEAYQIYLDEILGRECVVHWRMRTHGTISMANTHPYVIFGEGAEMPMAMMHNGILSQGNSKDKNMSDTWHYVQDTLVPLLAKSPEMFNSEPFMDVIESHIGYGNKFILMNHLGETAIMNGGQFVEYKGALLSNTYAWTSSKGGFGFSSKRYTSSGYGGSSVYAGASWWKDQDLLEDDDGTSMLWRGNRPGATKKAAKEETVYEDEDGKGKDPALCNEVAEILDHLEFRGHDDLEGDISTEDLYYFVESNGSDLLWEALDLMDQDQLTTDDFYTLVINGSYKKVSEDTLRDLVRGRAIINDEEAEMELDVSIRQVFPTTGSADLKTHSGISLVKGPEPVAGPAPVTGPKLIKGPQLVKVSDPVKVEPDEVDEAAHA